MFELSDEPEKNDVGDCPKCGEFTDLGVCHYCGHNEPKTRREPSRLEIAMHAMCAMASNPASTFMFETDDEMAAKAHRMADALMAQASKGKAE